MDKYTRRIRRAYKTRARIKQLEMTRLCVFRSNNHIYAQIINADGSEVLSHASTLDAEIRQKFQVGSNIQAASEVGKMIAEKAKLLGIERVAFDRSGFQYHGRVKALADAARAHGLDF
ncbi:50S ribosomal protein L18 [Eikenella sp. S3360]|uniref:Large ribosomal subunit protein uL18 n=1 Tax=Eikenella glucosivorans TaxID=2766967 RepID=A0ABS0NCL2_9NEIS|nr:50S ribosomal protein L18 [Eikenella glucosivorans]MBH5330047.1 50S ribosomal protein L18 [Eikenella glucosivorans]